MNQTNELALEKIPPAVQEELAIPFHERLQQRFNEAPNFGGCYMLHFKSAEILEILRALKGASCKAA